jgi:IS4 transposase
MRLRETIVETEVRGQPQRLRLISNLVEGVSAATIGRLYRQRWQVELFFRWLKCFGNFQHLLSATRPGVQAQFYVVVIAAMLMDLQTGGRPSKYLFSLMSLV